jgi:hypothetical protein
VCGGGAGVGGEVFPLNGASGGLGTHRCQQGMLKVYAGVSMCISFLFACCVGKRVDVGGGNVSIEPRCWQEGFVCVCVFACIVVHDQSALKANSGSMSCVRVSVSCGELNM